MLEQLITVATDVADAQVEERSAAFLLAVLRSKGTVSGCFHERF